MNQILCVDSKCEKVASAEIKPIIRFFAVISILFSLILISEGIYALYFKDNINLNGIGNPTLNTEINGSTVIITAEYAKGIDKIVYSWNNGSEAILQETGKAKVREIIDLPIGTNILNMSIIDVDGKMTRYAKREFTFTEGIDTTKPEITMAKGNNIGSIKLTITEDTELKKVTYQWNSEEEVEIEIGDEKLVEKEILAKEGQNELTVKAIDKSENSQISTKIIKGSMRPEIKVGKDGNYLIIKLTDDDGIDKMEYDLNGKKYTVDKINAKEYEYRQEMSSGENYIIINVYDINGLVTEFKGKSVI